MQGLQQGSEEGVEETRTFQVAAHFRWWITPSSLPCRAVPALQNNIDANAASVISQFVPVPDQNQGDTNRRKERLGGMASLVADLNNASDIASVSTNRTPPAASHMLQSVVMQVCAQRLPLCPLLLPIAVCNQCIFRRPAQPSEDFVWYARRQQHKLAERRRLLEPLQHHAQHQPSCGHQLIRHPFQWPGRGECDV